MVDSSVAVDARVYLDVDTTLLEPHRPGEGPHLAPSALEGLARLRDGGLPVVLLLDPGGSPTDLPDPRPAALAAVVDADPEVTMVQCPHEPQRDGPACGCAKPGTGLIELASHEGASSGWLIGGDQASIQAGRAAGLRTIRVGPPVDDHRATVHRADYEARDLVDAANRVMLEALSAA